MASRPSFRVDAVIMALMLMLTAILMMKMSKLMMIRRRLK